MYVCGEVYSLCSIWPVDIHLLLIFGIDVCALSERERERESNIGLRILIIMNSSKYYMFIELSYVKCTIMYM